MTFESELLNQESGQTFWSNEKCLYHSENFLQASWLLFKGGTERLVEIEEECAKEKWEKLKKASDPDHFWGDSFHNQDIMFYQTKWFMKNGKSVSQALFKEIAKRRG